MSTAPWVASSQSAKYCHVLLDKLPAHLLQHVIMMLPIAMLSQMVDRLNNVQCWTHKPNDRGEGANQWNLGRLNVKTVRNIGQYILEAKFIITTLPIQRHE